MPPKTTPSPKKRATPKSDEARKFLRDYLADGRKSSEEAHEEANKRGISSDTLNRASVGTVDKGQEKGPEGPRVSYWSLLPPTPPAPKSKATIREESIAFKSGYERAVNDMLLRLTDIVGEKSNRKTAQNLFNRFYEELCKLKPR